MQKWRMLKYTWECQLIVILILIKIVISKKQTASDC